MVEPAGQTYRIPGMVDVDIYLGGVAQEPLSAPERLTEGVLSLPQAFDADSPSALVPRQHTRSTCFGTFSAKFITVGKCFTALSCRWSCVWFDAKPEGITEFRAYFKWRRHGQALGRCFR